MSLCAACVCTQMLLLPFYYNYYFFCIILGGGKPKARQAVKLPPTTGGQGGVVVVGVGVPLFDKRTSKLKSDKLTLKDITDLLSRWLIGGYSTINYNNLFILGLNAVFK